MVLDRLYNAFPELAVRSSDGKKVFLYGMATNATTNWTAVREIESNGGRNDVVTVPVDNWDAPNAWQYLRLCNTSGPGHRSPPHLGPEHAMAGTTVVLPGRPCSAAKTPASPVGSQRVVNADAAFGSFPLGSPTRLNGLLIRKMFEDAFRDPPDWLFMPSWNEFVVNNKSFGTWGYRTNGSTHFHTTGLEDAE